MLHITVFIEDKKREHASLLYIAKEEGLEQGREEGLEEGASNERLIIAKELIGKNVSNDIIIDVTKLTLEQVLEIRKNI